MARDNLRIIALIVKALSAKGTASNGSPKPSIGLSTINNILPSITKIVIALKKEKDAKHHQASIPPATIKNSHNKTSAMVSKYLSNMALFYKGCAS